MNWWVVYYRNIVGSFDTVFVVVQSKSRKMRFTPGLNECEWIVPRMNPWL